MPSNIKEHATYKLPDSLTTSTSILETITSTTRILHLLHHRNKNQHRSSIWWRQFSSLRREIRRLHSDLEALHAIRSGASKIIISSEPTKPRSEHGRRRQRQRLLRQSSTASSGIQLSVLQVKPKRIKIAELEKLITQRLEFWLDATLVERWYRAFSQLVADPQYAPLGLVLIAILAQSCSILGVTGALQKMADVGEVVVRKTMGKLRSDTHRLVAAVKDNDLDEGVRVQRHDYKVEPDAKTEIEDVPRPTSGSKRKEKSMKRKSKSNLDAIDAIFDGL